MSQYTKNTSEALHGHCHCGCGQKTLIARKTQTKRGWVKGEPMPYLLGHSTRSRDSLVPPNPSGLCMCGCGMPAPIATITSARHNRIKGQHVRFIRGHGGRKPITDRFWQHVQKSPDGCWLWTGGKTSGGYGVLGVDGRDGGKTTAHRFSYEIHCGSIPEHMDVCHHCDTPSCVRPDHLFVGTRQENMQDMVRKNRHKNRKTNLRQAQDYRPHP